MNAVENNLMKYNSVRLAYCLPINPLHSIRENCAEFIYSNEFWINLQIFLDFTKKFTSQKSQTRAVRVCWVAVGQKPK